MHEVLASEDDVLPKRQMRTVSRDGPHPEHGLLRLLHVRLPTTVTRTP